MGGKAGSENAIVDPLSSVRPTFHTNPKRKRSFISPVRPTFHTNPTRKRSFISPVRPTFHTNPIQKRSNRKPSLNWRNLKTSALRLSLANHDNSLPSFTQTQIKFKLTGDFSSVV